MSVSRTARWALLVIVTAGALVYVNSLSSPFVLDDEDAIVRNPHITSLTPLSSAMSAPAQSSFAGRPVAALSLAVSYAVGGLTPASFRIWNIALLIASALTLFGIVRRTLLRAGGALSPAAEWLAFAIAIVWLLHPVNSEVVGYVTQRTESMMGLFYLLTLYAAIRALDEPATTWRWAVIAVVVCAAGMACKESMVTAPVMVLLYDAVFGAGSLREALRRRGGLHAGLAATWLVLLLLNIDGPRAGSAGFATAVSPSAYLLSQAGMIVTYLKLAVWPNPLVLDYGRAVPVAVGDALPSVLVVAALLAAVAWAWMRGHHVLAFLGTWFFVTLAPTSSIIPIATEVGAERRLYLPLMALVILAVLAIRRAVPPKAFSSAVFLIAVVFGGLTIARNFEYQDPVGIWRTVVERRPHGRAHYNLGIALKAAGRGDEARAHYEQALATEPAAHYALGFEAAQEGRLEESVAALQEFLRLRPADPMSAPAALLLGESLTRLDRAADAERAFRQALDLAPALADAHGKLADLLLAQRRFADAIAEYRGYLAAMPGMASAHHSLGLALASIGQEAQAVPAFERAVSLNQADPQFRMSLGTALAATGRLDDAITQYREGLRLAPANAGMMSALAVALADRGDRDESLALFRRALQIAPGDPTIQSDFRTALALIQQRR